MSDCKEIATLPLDVVDYATPVEAAMQEMDDLDRGRNEFGDVRREQMRIDKSRHHLCDGEIGLSVDDGKRIMKALQRAVMNQEMDTYALARRVCPDCHRFRPVKDCTIRRIRTVFGTVEVRNRRWMVCIFIVCMLWRNGEP